MEMINRTAGLLIFILISTSVSAQIQVTGSDFPHQVVSENCNTCHISDSWDLIHFKHDKTRFPLTGMHMYAGCRQCHSLKNFAIVERNCSGCHEDIHRGQVGSQCGNCHTAEHWQNVRPDVAHARTRFPLLGPHQNLDCSGCHGGSMNSVNFAQVSNSCYSCHSDSYQQSELNHQAAGFSIHCDSCHDTQTWKKARYNHPSSFSIYFGEHMMRWDTCKTCHPDRNNFKLNYCGNCHGFSTFSGAHDD